MNYQYVQLHIPQLCKCEGHHKVFNHKVDSVKCKDSNDFIETLRRWNSQAPCWVYTPGGNNGRTV